MALQRRPWKEMTRPADCFWKRYRLAAMLDTEYREYCLYSGINIVGQQKLFAPSMSFPPSPAGGRRAGDEGRCQGRSSRQSPSPQLHSSPRIGLQAGSATAAQTSGSRHSACVPAAQERAKYQCIGVLLKISAGFFRFLRVPVFKFRPCGHLAIPMTRTACRMFPWRIHPPPDRHARELAMNQAVALM